MIGLYQHRNTWVHRLSPGVKLLLLLLASSIMFFINSIVPQLLLLLSVLALYPVAGLHLRDIWRQFYPVAWLLLLVFAGQLVFNHWSTGVVVVLRLIALILLAALVTLTTRTSDMMATIVLVLRPLCVLGVNTEKTSLMLILTVRYIPLLFRHYTELRDAQRARGIRPGTISLVLPLLIRALRLADQLAEAIDARAYESLRPAR